MSSPVVSPIVGYESKETALPVHLSENERVVFTKVITITKPRLPLAIVYYSLDGVPQQSALRIDFGKQVFLDHLADSALDEQVSPKARNIVTYLGNLRSESMASV